MRKIYEIIVIGVSLGGLYALEDILSKFPEDFPTPIAIIQHRIKNSSSTLVDLLGRNCKLPLKSITDKDEIEMGTIYISPGNYHILVEDDHFALTNGKAINFAKPSIDLFFESVSEKYKDKAIGVILTGANSDGSKGIRLLKNSGSLTIAQDPTTAESAVMPQSAIDTTSIDDILPLEAIGDYLVELCYGK